MTEPLTYHDLRVFRPHAVTGVLLAIFVAAGSLPPILVVTLHFRGHRPTTLELGYIAAHFIYYSCLASWVLLHTLNRRVRISGESLTYRGPFRERSVAWCEVMRIELVRRSRRLISVRVYSPKRWRVNLGLFRRTDREEIEAIIRARVPPERLEEVNRGWWR